MSCFLITNFISAEVTSIEAYVDKSHDDTLFVKADDGHWQPVRNDVERFISSSKGKSLAFITKEAPYFPYKYNVKQFFILKNANNGEHGYYDLKVRGYSYCYATGLTEFLQDDRNNVICCLRNEQYFWNTLRDKLLIFRDEFTENSGEEILSQHDGFKILYNMPTHTLLIQTYQSGTFLCKELYAISSIQDGRFDVVPIRRGGGRIYDDRGDGLLYENIKGNFIPLILDFQLPLTEGLGNIISHFHE